jgi:hypothetical protein
MLYDHEADPNENANIAGRPELAPMVERLSAMAAQRRQADQTWDATHGSEPLRDEGSV